jgi:hypothetical protein
MALPKKTTSKPIISSEAASSEPKAVPAVNPMTHTFTDEYGVVYLGNIATVSVSRDVKLSRNYQSVGLHAGVSFQTHADEAQAAIPKIAEMLKKVMDEPLRDASDDLDKLA